MTTLTRKERWTFSVLLPLCALVAGYLLVLATTQGAGSSIGFRALGALIALRASLGGADAENALAKGREGGLTSLEGAVKERLAGDDAP